MPDLIIRNDEDAFAYLKQAIDGTLSEQDAIKIGFENWPVLTIELEGGPFDDVALTSTTMKALIDVQTAVYHTYAQLKYGEANTSKLSVEEKEKLEIVVKVEKGSTNLNIDLQSLAESAVTAMVGKMDSTQVAMVAITAAVLFVSGSVIKRYLNDRKDIRLAEIKNEGQAAALENIRAMSAEETKRTKIITDAMTKRPELNVVREEVEVALHSLVKAGGQAGTVEIQGNALGSDAAIELSKATRETSEEIRKDGTYRVEILDAKNKDKFKFGLYNLSTKERFNAVIRDETSNSNVKATVDKAITTRSMVDLTIFAKSLHGQTHSAVITGATLREGTEQQEDTDAEGEQEA
jgi:hypothetical protein